MNLVQDLLHQLDVRFLDIHWLMRQLDFWMRKLIAAAEDVRRLAFRLNLRVCLSLIVNLHHWWICTRYWRYSMLYLKLQMNRDICPKRLDPSPSLTLILLKLCIWYLNSNIQVILWHLLSINLLIFCISLLFLCICFLHLNQICSVYIRDETV